MIKPKLKSESHYKNWETYGKRVNYTIKSEKPMEKEWIILWVLRNLSRESVLYYKIGENYRKRMNYTINPKKPTES